MKKILYFLFGAAMFHPAVPSGAALCLGICLALTVGNPFVAFTKKWTSYCLMGAVVGLGFGMDLLVVGRVGAQGVGYTALTIGLTMVIGLIIGAMLRVSRDASVLIAAGTAICGGSAIAAVSAAIRAKSEDVSVALATVFLLNAAALFLFPPLGHYFGLSSTQFGLWSALAVHDISSVAGTTLQYGASAVQVGTSVKLARALWITPLTLFVGMLYSRGGQSKGKATVPWFIFGFILASALVTWVPSFQPAGHMIAGFSRRVLVFTLFLIGSNLTKGALNHVGFKPFAQGLLLWILAASGSLLAIHYGWIRV